MATADVTVRVADTEQMRVAVEALAVIAAEENIIPAAAFAEEALVEVMRLGTRIAA